MGKKGTAARMAKTKKIMAQYGLTQAPEQHNPAHTSRLPAERGGILPGEPPPSGFPGRNPRPLPKTGSGRRPPDAPQRASAGSRGLVGKRKSLKKRRKGRKKKRR